MWVKSIIFLFAYRIIFVFLQEKSMKTKRLKQFWKKMAIFVADNSDSENEHENETFF